MARGAALLLLLLALAGCGGGDDEGAPPAETVVTAGAGPTEAPAQTTTESGPVAFPGIPDELAGYDDWTRLNAEPIPPRAADPHDGTKDVYASVPAGADGVYPDGAIVVKEATRPGADFIGLVAMMRKERGAQPDHNDWVWVEWVRDGADEEFQEIASGATCYSCHVGARETDYVFTP